MHGSLLLFVLALSLLLSLLSLLVFECAGSNAIAKGRDRTVDLFCLFQSNACGCKWKNNEGKKKEWKRREWKRNEWKKREWKNIEWKNNEWKNNECQ